MELVNTTPIPAALQQGPVPGTDDLRLGALIAKATFRIAGGRALELETQEPEPLHWMDEETELGLIPRDDLVRTDEAFEVILLGAAYAPGGQPVIATNVVLSVGAVQHELWAIGDRRWLRRNGSYAMSEPEPFVRMPLTWARAFGGTVAVEIDEDSFVDVADVRNRAGRGFDPAPAARSLAQALETPPDYPTYPDDRLLPNLEHPDARIRRPDDAPEPLCWATVPMDSGLHMQRVVDGVGGDALTAEQLMQQPSMLYRAHPQWVLPMPPQGTPVVLKHATPGGLLSFTLPMLRVVFDYINNGRTATRDLMPQMMVLYPEANRLTITYRKLFNFRMVPGTERAVRLRTENGWYRPSQSEG